MNNSELQIKYKQRLNKGDSQDYLNIECWMISEAHNKAQDAWTTRQIEGINQTKTTAEGSIRSIDKLQVLLTPLPITMVDKEYYWECPLPGNYLDWSRISANAEANCCPPRRLKIFLGEEADRDIDLLDKDRQPSFEWSETFATVLSNTIRIYTNDQFDIVDPSFTYYRKPVHIAIAGCTNLDTGIVTITDVESEFPDNITELIIDEGAAILAQDMDSYQKMQILNTNAELSN